MLSEELLYPLFGAAMAIVTYFAFFHKPKVSEKDRDALHDQLMAAAQEGDLELCQELVEEEGSTLPSGPDWIHRTTKKTAIHQAAQYGKGDVVEWLVLEKDVPVDLSDFAKMRPLHYAAMKGRTQVCKQLLQLKADPDAHDTAGYTCMHFAASGGYEETIEALLKAKGDVNGRDVGGYTPLMLASIKGKAAAVQWMLKWGR